MSGVVSNVFKSICEEYLRPAGVKVGGYPQELFKDLAEHKREAYECRICYLLAKEAQRCCNGHLFCAACIYAWCLTSEDNVDRCPVCRQHGSYHTDAGATVALAQEGVVCPSAGCEWHGKLSDLRSHEHGLAFAGVDARSAGLPFVRSPAGQAVFPDFGDGAVGGFRASLDMERIRRRQRLARMQGHVLDGQARLSFLMSLFEEDLERRRSNLAAIASMQRRFHGQQFDQLMRLESELGEITASLLRLIESSSSEALRFNHALQPDASPPGAAAGGVAACGLTAAAAPAATSAAAAAVGGAAESTSSLSVPWASPAGSAAPAALASSSRERLLQRESLANVLSRVLHGADASRGGDRHRPVSGSGRDRSSLDRPWPAGSTAPSPPPLLQQTVRVRQLVPADHLGLDRAPTTVSRGSPGIDAALCDSARARKATELPAALATPPSRRGVAEGGASVSATPSALKQHQQPDRPVATAVGSAYNPHVITYPPHRPLGGMSQAAGVAAPRSQSALPARTGSAAAAPTATGGRFPAVAAPTAAAALRFALAAATAPPSSAAPLPQSSRHAIAQGANAATKPNSVARSSNS